MWDDGCSSHRGNWPSKMMGSLRGVVLSVIQIFFVAATLLCHPSHAIGQDQVNKICHQSEDFGFCFNIVGSDPRIPAANLEGVCGIVVSKILDQVSETSGKIPGLLQGLTDPVDKQRMTVCRANYTAADGEFKKAWNAATSRDFAGVLNWIQQGTGQVINCENIYRRNSPVRESPLTVDNHNIIKLAGITLIVLGML